MPHTERSHEGKYRGGLRLSVRRVARRAGVIRRRSCCIMRRAPRHDRRTDRPGSSAAREVAVRMAVEAWRFSRAYEKIISRLSSEERGRFEGSLAAFGKKIEEALGTLDMRIVNIEGSLFDPGIAATPLNIGDFAPGGELIVDRMIEPIIMGRDGVVRMGSVTLRKGAS